MAAWVLPAIAGGLAFLDWLNGRSSTDKAANRQFAALDKAQGAIQGAADKAMSYQQPYLQNAGQDYTQMRGLVNSGFFQQPYGKSFQSQSFAGPSFGFNPAQGSASFASWQPQGGPAGFQSQPLPSMPQFAMPPAPQAPAAPGGGLIPTPGPTPDAIQRALDANRNNTLGDTAPPLPNKGLVPNPNDPTSQVYRNPTQPLTLQEMMELMRRHGRTGPTVPYPGPTGPYSGPTIPGGR